MTREVTPVALSSQANRQSFQLLKQIQVQSDKNKERNSDRKKERKYRENERRKTIGTR